MSIYTQSTRPDYIISNKLLGLFDLGSSCIHENDEITIPISYWNCKTLSIILLGHIENKSLYKICKFYGTIFPYFTIFCNQFTKLRKSFSTVRRNFQTLKNLSNSGMVICGSETTLGRPRFSHLTNASYQKQVMYEDLMI